MGFLNRLRGIPDEPVPPRAKTRFPAEFDLASLPEPDAEVRVALDRGQLIAAVKAYREQSGAGLAEAKRVVDAIARGDRLVGGAAQTQSSRTRADAAPGVDTLARIDQLVIDGELIAAIKAYREAYGVGLRESKEAIERKRDQLRNG